MRRVVSSLLASSLSSRCLRNYSMGRSISYCANLAGRNGSFGGNQFGVCDFGKNVGLTQPFSWKFRHFSTFTSEKIRNVAIIAHVDHGKTTLLDAMLKQSGSVENIAFERVMDSNDLEKERGITINAKSTSVFWKGHKLNIVDTPGHGDFGGEVERILNMVDGVVLLVDVNEGVMSQTKFVLSKALHARKRAIVVLNKIDRSPNSRDRIEEVEVEIFDLFSALEATEEQMEYVTLYASGRNGWVVGSVNDAKENLHVLFDKIVSTIPAPKVDENSPFSFLVTSLEHDQFIGRILNGRIMSGKVSPGTKMKALSLNGEQIEEAKIVKVLGRNGLERIALSEGIAGDIVGIAGFQKCTVTSTVCDLSITKPISADPLDPPVISMTFSVNNSPYAGQESSCTFPQIKKRLEKEVENNVSVTLRAVPGREAVEVCGRGEMQLSILIENMRREGFEFTVSPPNVVYKNDENGKLLEPLEEVTIDVDNEYIGVIMEKISMRKGEVVEIKQIAGKTRIIAHCASRTLVGFRTQLLTETRGTAVYNHLFHKYIPHMGELDITKRGSLISKEKGIATAYALAGLEARGVLFINPGTPVYPGLLQFQIT